MEPRRRDIMSTSKLQTLSGTVTAHDQQEMSVSMYSHLKSLRGATPALTIRAMSPQRVHEQYEKMQQLKKALRRDAADILAQCKVEFIMHAQTPEKDSFDFGSAVADDGEGTSSACDTIVSFLRTHLLDVWRGLAAEELESVHGRLYIFDPFVKARNGSNVNTTWHQDGASLPQADDYFAHYYLPEDEASGLGATDWVEVAIPEADCCLDTDLEGDEGRTSSVGSMFTGSDEDDELVMDWSGMSDDTRRERISASNFLALPTTERALVVIHDSGCFHRVPLPALFRKPRRAIVRIEFHGRDRKGDKLLFAASASGLTDPDTGCTASWSPMRTARLPPGLASLSLAYDADQQGALAAAEEQRAEHERSQHLPHQHTSKSSDGFLSAYVHGKVHIKKWLERRLTERFGDLPMAFSDLA